MRYDNRERVEHSSVNNPPECLPGDVTLHFRSMSLLDGHAGAKVVYQPSLHRAYHYGYVIVKMKGLGWLLNKLKKGNGYHESYTRSFADIPESIMRREDAEKYLRDHLPYWFH